MATLKGKYVVSAPAIKRIPGNSSITTSKVYSINYTSRDGTKFTQFMGYAPTLGGATLYFGNEVSSQYEMLYNGAFRASTTYCDVIDFGTTDQTIDDTFYNNFLSYVLIPVQNVGPDGFFNLALNLRDELVSNINKGVNQSLPSVQAVSYNGTSYAYNSSNTFTAATFTAPSDSLLVVIATPQGSSDQLSTTISLKNIGVGATQIINLSDNVYSLRLALLNGGSSYNLTVQGSFGDSGSSNSSPGKIKGIYLMKIGG